MQWGFAHSHADEGNVLATNNIPMLGSIANRNDDLNITGTPRCWRH